MYTITITKAIKKCQSMKSEILSLKIIINGLFFLWKTVVIQQNA